MILNMVGGTGMNFRIRAYETEEALPETAAENTIAVITGTEVTGWTFQTSQPEAPEEGMVWFYTSASSPVAFNALKKNAVVVCPLNARQYVDGAWADKAAKSFLGGAWVDWSLSLYRPGDACADLTGGWAASEGFDSEWASSQSGEVVLNSDSMVARVGYVSGQIGGLITTRNKVTVTGYTKLYVRCSYTETLNELSAKIGLFSSTCAYPTADVAVKTIEANTPETLYCIDISGISGSFYAGIWIGWKNASGDTASVTVKEIYLA